MNVMNFGLRHLRIAASPPAAPAQARAPYPIRTSPGLNPHTYSRALSSVVAINGSFGRYVSPWLGAARRVPVFNSTGFEELSTHQYTLSIHVTPSRPRRPQQCSVPSR